MENRKLLSSFLKELYLQKNIHPVEVARFVENSVFDIVTELVRIDKEADADVFKILSELAINSFREEISAKLALIYKLDRNESIKVMEMIDDCVLDYRTCDRIFTIAHITKHKLKLGTAYCALIGLLPTGEQLN